MWPDCTPWLATVGNTSRPPTISPAGRGVMLNLPPVSLLSCAANVWAEPNSVTSEVGQLVAMSHSISGRSWLSVISSAVVPAGAVSPPPLVPSVSPPPSSSLLHAAMIAEVAAKPATPTPALPRKLRRS